MRNKEGFTLIELLAVIAVIALISLIAIPNIVGLSTGVRKDQMLDDAKKLISLAKYKVNKDYSLRANPPQEFSLADLNINGDIDKDPDGGLYTMALVRYSKESETAHYCIILIGSKRAIGNVENIETGEEENCIDEENLYSRRNVVDR